MRFRLPLLLILGASLFLSAGCNRLPEGELVAESNEPAFEEGKRLLRQGKEQAALAAFTRVIELRSDGAPESHLEVGLLYQSEIKDPIAAIYHFRSYLELKPNSPQADLVRQRIDKSTRDFARTLPAQPLENQVLRNDLLDVVESLQKENSRLKDEVAGLRSNLALAGNSRGTVATLSSPPSIQASSNRTAPTALNPITPAPLTTLENRPVERPTRPVVVPIPAAGKRIHAVVKGDTLYALARRYYDSPTRVSDIVAANRGTLTSVNDPLQIGMQLVIPE